MKTIDKTQSVMCAITATDALGRRVEPLAGVDRTRQTGLFYFLWIGQHGSAKFDNASLPLETQMNDRSGEDVHHYWNKPLFGYYNSEDEWVFRRHLQLFVTAGIDYLVFDTTNGYFYPEVCHRIFPVALEMLEDGYDIPRFVFDTNWNSSGTVEGIYREYFDPATENGKKYAPLWYRYPDHNGRNRDKKPWIIAKNNNEGELAYQNYSTLPEEIRNFFYLRESAWFREEQTSYAFPTDVDNPHLIDGMISVSTAQHTSGAFSDSVFETDMRDSNRGRGWSKTDRRNDRSRMISGANYQGEWDYAMNFGEKTESVFLTTWNEWVAQKQPFGANGRKCCYFVDQYNDEFSRDIEPTEGVLGDNYYMQTVENIRRFKGLEGEYPAHKRQIIDLNNFDSFAGSAEYYGFSGAAKRRSCKSSNFSLPVYGNGSGRNNVIRINVAHDAEYVYFLLTCEEPLTEREQGDESYMNLLIATEGKGTFGFDYRIGRLSDGERCLVERLNGENEGGMYAQMRKEGNRLGLRIPKTCLGIEGENFALSFKAMDNVKDLGSISSIYADGVCCPVGRFGYYYKA